jgi:hypothetical protein
MAMQDTTVGRVPLLWAVQPCRICRRNRGGESLGGHDDTDEESEEDGG